MMGGLNGMFVVMCCLEYSILVFCRQVFVFEALCCFSQSWSLQLAGNGNVFPGVIYVV